MARKERQLALQPSIDALVFEHDRQASRSPLSIALDDASSIQYSATDFEYSSDRISIQHSSLEKHYHFPPSAQQSCDPIISRDETLVDSDLVSWESDNDPENPLHWPLSRKIWISFLASFMTFVVSVASSIFSADIQATTLEFETDGEVMVLGVSLYVLGFACGPLIFGPISELYGRSRPMMFGFFCFAIFQIPLAVSQNIETVFICRFFAAAFGAAPLAIAPGILVDLWKPYARGIATLLWLITVYAGPTAGPLIGAFTLENRHMGWRWTAWLVLITAMFMFLLALLTISETFPPILLQRKAARLRLETRNWALHSERDEEPIGYSYLARKYGLKPLQMLLQEPILASMTAFMSLVYAIMYLMLIGFPYSFALERGWNQGLASLPFLGLFAGYVLAFFICVLESTFRFQRLLQTANGHVAPEERLPTMIAGSFILISGLFWFAWTSSPSISWISQVLASVPIGCGIFLVFVPGLVYLMDVYTINAASALAANAFIRAALACAFPLIASPMYDRLGVGWAMSLLGFLCMVLSPFPILFYVFGKRIRSWSKYVPHTTDRL